MSTSAALSLLATGVWQWETATDTVRMDTEAARLLGLPPRAAELPTAAVRARLHGLDYVELIGSMDLARSEDTVAEGRLRVVDADGSVLRTVRVRLRPSGDRDTSSAAGTIQEVLETGPGAAGDPRLSRDAFLIDAGRELAEAVTTDQVLRTASSLAMPGFAPGGLVVFRHRGDELEVIGTHGEYMADVLYKTVRLDRTTPATTVARTGQAVYLSGPDEYRERFPWAWERTGGQGMRAWAYLPLIAGGEVVGIWQAAFPDEVAFSPDERSVLTTVARMLAQALVRAQTLDSERALSAGLQRSLMPEGVPELPGFAVAARYVATGGGLSIGGDWYDAIPLPSGRFALVIGDVQGHDVRAAGLMSQLRIAIRAYASEGHRPDEVLSRANRFLNARNDSAATEAAESGGDPYDDITQRFATCLYIEADPASAQLRIARAGALDPAMALADGTMVIHPTAGGLPLGVEPAGDFPVSTHVLAPGETMLLCTDGLVETGGHDLYSGQARLQAAFYATVGADVELVADRVLASATGPESYANPGPHAELREDDIAFLLLRTSTEDRPAPPGTARHMHMVVPQAELERVGDARHQLRGMVHDWADEDQAEAAVLAFSEMITNVMVHTGSTASVQADVTGPPGARTLKLRVGDRNGTLPHRKHPGELGSSGRGVLLLEELSGAWGIDPQGDGKVIWCEFYEQGDRRLA